MKSFELPLGPNLRARCNENGSLILKPCQEDDRLSMRLSPEEFISLFALLHDPDIEDEVQRLHDQQMSEPSSQRMRTPAQFKAEEYNSFIQRGGSIKGRHGNIVRFEAVRSASNILYVYEGGDHAPYIVDCEEQFRMIR